ncbi:MAG: trypsin-like serine protease, partial [Luteimonas sp.]
MNSLAMRCITLFAALFLVSSATARAGEEDNLGTSRQGLVGGTVISADTQEKYALLTLTSPIGSCSASLLRNNWAITAAHCVDTAGAPGQFMTVPDGSVTLKANWATEQTRPSMRVITFRPLDIAIVRVAQPFAVRGSTTRYNRDIFRDGQFPYFGQLSPVPLMIFGRGINQFAQMVNGVPMPSSSDGQYRVGFMTTRREEGDLVWYPSVSGQMIAGGDSGGPSFATVRGTDDVLYGVHALCHSRCLAGQDCSASPWTWVSETPECADAPIAPIWDDINRYLGAFVSEAEPAVEPPPPGFIGTFGTTPPNYQPMWVYAVKDNGDLMWYRKDSGTAAWQGPKKVGNGWAAGYKDVIAAGGNAMYALTDDGTLRWYRHDGFNDGSFTWKGPVDVARGWRYTK